MTLNERIMYAEEKRDEAIRNGDNGNILFWVGYLDGLHAVMRDAGAAS